MGRRVMLGAGATAAVAAAAAIALVVFDDDSATTYPPAAEPAKAPPVGAKPAGKVFDVGTMPEGLTADPATGLIAIGLRSPNVLAIFDPSKEKIVRRIPISSAPRHLSFDEADDSVLVPAEQTDQLIRVPLPRGKPVATAVGYYPHDAAVAATGSIFVGDEMGDTVSVVSDDRLLQNLPADQQPGGVAAAGPYVAVIAVAQRTLSVFDAKTLKQIASIPAGDGPTHLKTLGRRAFVTDTDGGAVREYEVGPDPHEISSTEVGGAPYGIAVDDRRQRLWVTLTASNQVLEFAVQPRGLRRIAAYPTVRQPNTVVVEPSSGDAFVASRSNGQLQRIKPRGD